MRQLLASCLGAALGLTAFTRAEEVEWRSATKSMTVSQTGYEATKLPDKSPDRQDNPPVERELRIQPHYLQSQSNKQYSATKEPQSQKIEPKTSNDPHENPIPGPCEWKPVSDQPIFDRVAEHANGQDGAPGDSGSPFFFRAEFLMWWIRGMNAPPLVSTGTLPPPPVFTGIENPRVLYGNGVVGGQFMPGARFSAGAWFDCCQTCGIEGSFFFLGRRTDRFRADSVEDNLPVLLRPITAPNLVNGVPIGETNEVTAFPPGFVFPPGSPFAGQPVASQTGVIDVTTSSALWGAELNLKEALKVCGTCCGGVRVDLFGGFRFLDLQEYLRVNENVVLGNGDLFGRPAGTRLFLQDFFGTRNDFYGGQLGLHAEWRRQRWFAELRSSFAFGDTHQHLLIDGFLTETPPGGTTTVFPGGLLALPGANIGSYNIDRFSFVTEQTLNFGYQLRPWCRAFVGYNFLFWTNVMRPGDQIDRVVDVTRIPRFLPPPIAATIAPVVPPRPMVLFRQTDFWAQDIQLGVELKY